MTSILFLIETIQCKQYIFNYLRKKTFSRISFTFLKSILSLEQFQKKDEPHIWCISEITDSKKRG